MVMAPPAFIGVMVSVLFANDVVMYPLSLPSMVKLDSESVALEPMVTEPSPTVSVFVS